jgi:hypothetical protein
MEDPETGIMEYWNTGRMGNGRTGTGNVGILGYQRGTDKFSILLFRFIHCSSIPLFQSSKVPIFHHSILPDL